MHREFDPAESPFRAPSRAPLYLFTAFLTALLVADVWPAVAVWLGGLPSWESRELFRLRFALLAAVLGGARALYVSLERLAEGRVGADLAIALASVAAILIGEPLVAAEVVLIAMIGECLEAVTFDRTRRALRGLAELFPTRCWVLRDGQEVRVLTTELAVGDRVVVKPGGKLPADGAVTAGRSALDTAALTGESLPREVGPGDEVLAGSINQFGTITVEVRKIAADTVAGQVIGLTAAALRDKGKGERLADRLARYFLPAVLALTAVTFFGHYIWQLRGTSPGAAVRLAAYPALAVLVVACPCPLVLATPAAVVAALGRLAGTGVLVKGGSVLERLAVVSAFAFDKTGTLTEGKPEVGDVLPVGSVTAEQVLHAAATAEQQSEHPLAMAISALARTRGLVPGELTEFRAEPGAGVSATAADGAALLVGSRRLLADRGVAIPEAAADILQVLDASGQTALLVARNGAVLGAVGVRDRLRPEAAGVLAELRDLGLTRIEMLTGDREAAARAAADRLPLSAIRAELLPAQKAELVAGATNGPAVAFVGDGVNDAPALARAAVGVVVGTGTDIAAAAGDVVLLGEPLRPLPMLVRLSREMTRIIRQNIVWFGFVLNLAGVAIAGWLWPALAPTAAWYEAAPLAGVVFHQIGSLAVLLNSMRLLAFERAGTNPMLLRLKHRYRDFEAWALTLHCDDIVHELGHRWKPVTVGVSLLMLTAWLASGLTQVGPAEVGVVRRFGAVRGVLDPGPHVRWPWPVESVTTLKPAEPRTVEIGFRTLTGMWADDLRRAGAVQRRLRESATESTALTWASGHDVSVLPVESESLLVTGDGNLVELMATARYTVSDPVAYLYATHNPDGLIRSAAESVFRELAAGQPFTDLLTANRAEFERAATARLAARLREVSADGLGVELSGLTVHDMHPPREVVPSYHAVAEAIQNRDRAVNEAKAEANRRVRRAEAEAQQLVREAEAEAAATVAETAAACGAFLAWVEARSTLPSAEEARLAAEREDLIRSGVSPDSARQEIASRREKLMAARKALTEFRLALEATVAVLRGRDKVLIDADNLPGKRHLLLADPAVVTLPGVVPRDR